jgi:hypothetical protein
MTMKDASMTIAAKSIIRRVVETIQDPTSIRWPVPELVRYLNDGQREVMLHRPDAMVKTAQVPLVAGSRQALPNDGTKLVNILRNATGTQRATRLVNREILDAQTPGWHGLPGVTEILHYMYDVKDPLVFWVYPPAASAGASLEVIYSATPADVLEPVDGATYVAVTGNLSVPDIYGNALQDYILYRAYAKDSEYAGNVNRAQAHYAAFANAMGIEIKAAIAVAPMSAGNPNVASMVAAG